MTTQMPFTEVARQFVAGLDNAYAHRSSDRLSDNTRRLYSRYAFRAAATLGNVPLTQITAQHVRDYVDALKREELAPASIQGHFQVLKSIVESVRDGQGNPLVASRWNLDYVGLPTVKAAQQNAPCASRSDVERAIAAGGELARLVAFLAATGLRIGEALSLTIGEGVNCYEPATGVIHVREGKTDAAARKVYLTESLRVFVNAQMGEWGSRLFPVRLQTIYTNLKRLGLPPCHAYRRFRATHCRAAHMVETVLKSQLGHALGGDITSRYDKSAQDLEFVKSEVERVGLGFSIRG
jgi:integrase